MSGKKGMNTGNKNRYKGGRLKVDFSLSGKPKEFFRQQAMLEIYGKEDTMREPTDEEIIKKCREMTKEWWKSVSE